MNYALILSLATKPNEEIVQLAKEWGIKLSTDDVAFLKTTLQDASLDWLVTGIPHYKLVEIEKRLGPDVMAKLYQLISQ